MRARRPRLLVAAVATTIAATCLPVGVPASSAARSAAVPEAAVPMADRVKSRKKALDAAIGDLNEQLEGTSRELVNAVAALRRYQVELRARQDELARAQAEAKRAADRYDALTAQLDAAKKQEESAAAEVQAGLDAIAETKSELGRIARDTYVNNGSASQLSLTLDATSPEEFAASMAAAATAMKVEERAKDRLTSQQLANRREADHLSAVRLQTAAYREQAEEVLRVKKAAEAKAAAARARIAQIVAGQRAAVNVIRVRAAAERARLAQLEAEQRKLQQILRARAAAAQAAARRRGHVSTVSGSGFLSRPADGPVTSSFGWRIHPIFHTRRMHTGTDFGVPCGTTVRAAADGVVILAGWSGGYGNRVVIDHGLVGGVGLATTYNHNSRILVHSGQRVRRGDAVAVSGTTGNSTGCHLHFEVLVNGNYVNPMRWL